MIFPSRFYGDPADCCDERRKLAEQSKERQKRLREQKSRRIKMLVKRVMKGK